MQAKRENIIRKIDFTSICTDIISVKEFCHFVSLVALVWDLSIT